MSIPAAIFPQWFDHPSKHDPAERAYPLRALDDDAAEPHSASHRAPLTASDEALAARVRAGDIVAFEELYRAYADGLVGFAVRLSGTRVLAQDIVADLFVHIWERRAEWHPRSGLRAYLYAAVRHRVSDAARAERRARARNERVAHDPSLAPATIPADQSAELSDELRTIWRIVDTFPPLRRQVMYLRWAREFSPDEIAVIVGLTRNAVDLHLSRAVRAIRDAVLSQSPGA